NADPDKPQYAAEVLGLRWLRAYFSGPLTINDAIAITGLRAHDVIRIGYAWFNWNIEPTVDQVEALETIALVKEEMA
ncbi:MAG: hypothetical protein AAAC48_27820, partial [Phyllobacterium sp.]|uniref:hypothetical protein n=1 Tax=Phyllobacterium sp. TaxID=1871046 RepID=UPI0030F30E33